MSELRAQIRHVVGVMTGTSIDAMDLALVRIQGRGLGMQARLVASHALPLGELAEPLRRAATQQPMTAGQFADLAWRFGELHAEAIEALVRVAQKEHASREIDSDWHLKNLAPPGSGPKSADGSEPDLIVVHGQTVFHKPPVSCQLVNPAPIAAAFDCDVIADLRQPDLARGGQGAPITPLADWVLFRSAEKSRAVINLGGFCNVTILPRETDAADHAVQAIQGFDVCACNQVLDLVAREALGRPFDPEGRAAKSGRPRSDAAVALLASLTRQQSGQRSLGTGDEASDWVHEFKPQLKAIDLAASAVNAIARCIISAIEAYEVDELVLAGGGSRNDGLCAALSELGTWKQHLRYSRDFDVPVESREAMAMAVLGALRCDGVEITLPQVTGRREKAAAPGERSRGFSGCNQSTELSAQG